MEGAIVWESGLDGKYAVRVITSYTGEEGEEEEAAHLEIWDDEDLIFKTPTSLTYGAIFGPDVADVARWQETAVAFVDDLKTH